jgi:hypothetical protein
MTRVELGEIPDSRALRRAICPTSNLFFFRFFIAPATIGIRRQKIKAKPAAASLAQYFHANNARSSRATPDNATLRT